MSFILPLLKKYPGIGIPGLIKLKPGNGLSVLSIAVLLKGADQVLGNHLCGPSFDLVAFYKMDQLPVLKQSDCR
jgi:hypothetical protein